MNSFPSSSPQTELEEAIKIIEFFPGKTMILSPEQFDAVVHHATEDQLASIMHKYNSWNDFKDYWKSHERYLQLRAPDKFWELAKNAWKRVAALRDPTQVSNIRPSSAKEATFSELVNRLLEGKDFDFVVRQGLR